MAPAPHKRYPTPWQRKTMWAALTAIFLVFLTLIVGTTVWTAAKLIAFLQPILIPVAIAVILAYLLDPLVTRLGERMGRTKAILLLFAIASLAITALLVWLVPLVSLQSANVARELPAYTLRARDAAVDLLYRYNQHFGSPLAGKGKASPATTFVDWLLATPTPQPRTTTPALNGLPSEKEIAPPPARIPEIGPPPPKLTSAERERIERLVAKQLPNLERQLPTLLEKFWNILRTSIGGFLGVTGFLLSFVMVPIYLFFLLKERPSIERRWKEYLPLRASPLKDEVAAVLSQINNYIIAWRCASAVLGSRSSARRA